MVARNARPAGQGGTARRHSRRTLLGHTGVSRSATLIGLTALGVLGGWAGPALGQTVPISAAVLQDGGFCRALHSVTDGPRNNFVAAVLPGFQPNERLPGTFHTEHVLVQGQALEAVARRVAQCASNGRWIIPYQRSDTATGREWYTATWGLPNLTNVVMSMNFDPKQNNTLTIVTFAVRSPDAAAAPSSRPPPAPVRPAARPPAQTSLHRCRDGREFTTEVVVQGNELSMILRFKGAAGKPVTLHPLDEPHSPFGNAALRFDMGKLDIPASISELRNGTIVKTTECPEMTR